jgi:hypothetical protein
MSILCVIPLVSLLFSCTEVSYETIKLQRPTTIDCKGKAYNNGKVTELQILADNVTIKRCKINGSIRTIGLGRNGESKGVKESSTTGTKIGTATTQKIGFFDKTPVVQPIAVADATDAASAITQLNALLARMRDLGLIAT